MCAHYGGAAMSTHIRYSKCTQGFAVVVVFGRYMIYVWKLLRKLLRHDYVSRFCVAGETKIVLHGLLQETCLAMRG